MSTPTSNERSERSREQIVKYLDHLAGCMRGELVRSSAGVSMRVTRWDAEVVQLAADALRNEAPAPETGATPWGTPREICTAEKGHAFVEYPDMNRCCYCGSPETSDQPAQNMTSQKVSKGQS